MRCVSRQPRRTDRITVDSGWRPKSLWDPSKLSRGCWSEYYVLERGWLRVILHILNSCVARPPSPKSAESCGFPTPLHQQHPYGTEAAQRSNNDWYPRDVILPHCGCLTSTSDGEHIARVPIRGRDETDP